MKTQTSMKNRLYLLLGVCLIPLTCIIVYLLVLVNSFSQRYDAIVANITKANTYNIVFKEDMDYLMYIIVVNADRAEELVDIDEVKQNIANIEAELAQVQAQMAKYLETLGL